MSLCLENDIFDKSLERTQLRTRFDSAAIVTSCNKLACKQDSGSVAWMSLSSSQSAVHSVFAFALFISHNGTH